MYDVGRMSEAGMSKLFAFVTCLICIFDNGLHNFSLVRYKQINKRIGRMIRQAGYFYYYYY